MNDEDSAETEEEVSQGSVEISPIEWPEFLSNHPPQHGTPVRISSGFGSTGGGFNSFPSYYLQKPDIILHCSSEVCDGNRLFEEQNKGVDRHMLVTGSPDYFLLYYRCKNCEQTRKIFALAAVLRSEDDNLAFYAVKIGEEPVFQPSIPRRVVNWFDKDHIEMLKKALRSEKQGMGLGAYAYYRRIVEEQKVLLFEKIIEIAKHENSSDELIQQLEVAKDNWQFTDSVASIKKAIPDSLKIKGHNPLLLLHDALSNGIHNLDDEECLARAKSIREILVLLGERMTQVDEEDAKISDALKNLMQKPRKKKESLGQHESAEFTDNEDVGSVPETSIVTDNLQSS